MKISFPKLEKKVLKFWNKNKIFEKSLKRGKKAKTFVFYEGPPTANGKPGIHHVLTRVFKDIICRYKTMQGCTVLRKAGWDTHGLPVELQIEKKLGIASKKDIEKLGIAKFNEKCKESVWKYKKEWERLTKRIGYWLDLDNPYITYDPRYIESLWWILKEVHRKGLLYQHFKVVHYCPRCGTTLSSHEVAQGYKKVKEPSVYVELRIKNPELRDSYLLIWTTTPWTLPGNVAVAVNPEFTYVKIKEGHRSFILAKERAQALGLEGIIEKELKGRDLVGLRYEALYPYGEDAVKTGYRVIPGKFVSLEEGTGLVHIAPAFGEDDMAAVKSQNTKLKKNKESLLPILVTVNEEGRFKFDVKKWAGMFFKEADPQIIKDLEDRELLFRQEEYEHDYPFCWRCKTPLLYYAKKSWFIKMKQLKKEMIANNKKINWVPAYLKEGRFGEWLRELKDWALSRERYWGTPLPVWQCKKCSSLEVIGSRKELAEKEYSSNQYFLLRHGDTIRTQKGKEIIYYEKEDYSLGITSKGVQRVRALIPAIRKANIDLVFSSDYFRTKETAKIITDSLGLKVKFDKRLRDVDLGKYRGRPKKELYEDFPDLTERFYKKPEKGENWLHCRKRMLSFIGEIEKKHQGKNILIVGHGDPLWLLEGAFKGLSQEELVEQKLSGRTIDPAGFRKVKFTPFPFNNKGELDLHRPYIDKMRFKCSQCAGEMIRVEDVLDCWFDSGSMPFAQYHYPFNNKKLIDAKKQFPADFICEAVDQTRGWFYTLLAVSTLLEKGSAYKNVVSLGHILDDKGEKMSKSKGNIVDPWYIINKYGIDVVRWYFYVANQPGDPKLFSEKELEERLKKFIFTFWNCFYFFSTYVSQKTLKTLSFKKPKTKTILDKWIVSRANSIISGVTKLLGEYDITGAARLLEDFIINDLSLWYIRRSRERFQNPATDKDLAEAVCVLGWVIINTIKISAPFIPFLSEKMYQDLIGQRQSFPESVHLSLWPKADKKAINKKLEEKMVKVRETVTKALAERAKAGIKVRQPLLQLQIKDKELEGEKGLLDLLKQEVNVKEIAFGKEVKLDTKITEDLEKEGMVREFIRYVQQMRKEAGLTPKDIISIYFSTSQRLQDAIMASQQEILAKTRAKQIFPSEKKSSFKKETAISGDKITVCLKK